jgi:hypothetical protein
MRHGGREQGRNAVFCTGDWWRLAGALSKQNLHVISPSLLSHDEFFPTSAPHTPELPFRLDTDALDRPAIVSRRGPDAGDPRPTKAAAGLLIPSPTIRPEPCLGP